MNRPLRAAPAVGRRERKRQTIASHLAAVAFALFEKQGYEAVTMEQIAAEADVAKATLYNYFPVKEALVARRFRDELVEGMAELAEALAAHKTFQSRMRFLLRESAAWHAARRRYMSYYIGYLNSKSCLEEAKTREGTATSVTHRILSEMFRVAQEAGEITRTVPADQLAWSFEFLLYGAITRWLTHAESDLAKEFLLAFDLLLNGVAVVPKNLARGRLKSASAGGARAK